MLNADLLLLLRLPSHRLERTIDTRRGRRHALCRRQERKLLDCAIGEVPAQYATLRAIRPQSASLTPVLAQHPSDPGTRDTARMIEDAARDRAIYQALKAADEVAAALQTHLIEEHGADPERAAAQSSSTNALKLLRQARERLGHGLRAIEADNIAESDEIGMRGQ
jgi:hypothetical protein